MEHKKFAIDLAKEAGQIIKENFTSNMKKEWKSDNTPVTETDLKINQLVIDLVKKQYPTYSILAEEGSHMIKDSEYTWVCDPIDGTIPFSHGMPTCAFCLALVKEGKPILGVIYDPFIDRLFFAEEGKGTYLNGNKIKVSTATTLNNSVIGISSLGKTMMDSLSIARILVEEKAKTVQVWSAIYTGMLVASGELVASIIKSKHPWDSASLKIIVEEAGGKVTSLYGTEQRYDQETDGALVTNGLLHSHLLKLIKDNPC